MSVIILLIIFSIVVALVFLIAFIWAVKSGQYDDSYSPSVRMLFDDAKNSKEKGKKKDFSTEKRDTDHKKGDKED